MREEVCDITFGENVQMRSLVLVGQGLKGLNELLTFPIRVLRLHHQLETVEFAFVPGSFPLGNDFG
ncbi:MAG TPA: hypothetical protein VJA21_10505 [Verrucomicrobiae bacterium]